MPTQWYVNHSTDMFLGVPAKCTSRIVNTLLRYGAVETRRDSVGKTPSLYPREWLAAAGATVEGDVSRNQSEMKAIVRSLRRGPAFRARSFLWPRAVVEVRGRPSWKVYPFDVRRSGQKRKRFVIMATLSRYTVFRFELPPLRSLRILAGGRYALRV